MLHSFVRVSIEGMYSRLSLLSSFSHPSRFQTLSSLFVFSLQPPNHGGCISQCIYAMDLNLELLVVFIVISRSDSKGGDGGGVVFVTNHSVNPKRGALKSSDC
ncbi:hypothetical protein M8C21_003972 [Ambrosia artemisiifolia]|uniref:Uncharacterized protein n=1 Tax=Ambrosia artemisiifolia TaxID=4212 RepID=A0AAD5C519_AMBAR|nr:hypothetical protein M8C21_003972 [Ambrosia artemisiifolia]